MQIIDFDFSTEKSIIVAGPSGSGKTTLITLLRQKIIGVAYHIRTDIEKCGKVLSNTIVHWTTEGILPQKTINFENAGIVLLLEKTHQEYISNINRRKHTNTLFKIPRYNTNELKQHYQTHFEYFERQQIPILIITQNLTQEQTHNKLIPQIISNING